ncbi:MAG: insulinase family protein, partial [Deltaproteobacteria bacterium]|nr:insulinase family protein [Deltaproteobacteria bacterium]
YKRNLDDPSRRLSRELFKQAYQVHPYGRPVIGTIEALQGLTRETAARFHAKYYKPENMLLVMAGDFKLDEIKARIKETFGKAIPGKVDKPPLPVEPAQKEPRVAVLGEDVKVARMALAFHIPEVKHEDITGLDMLAAILGQGRTSRLYREIKREKEHVYSIFSYTYTPQGPGLFEIFATLSQDKVIPALKAILDEAFALTRTEVLAEELKRVKLNIKADFIRSRSTMSGEARVAASFHAFFGDFRVKDKYLADIERLTPNDLRRIAARYLHPGNLTVALSLPKEAADTVTSEKLVSVVDRYSIEPEPQKVRKYLLENGATLLVKPDASLPLVSIRTAFLGGLRFETSESNGLNNFLAEIWDQGTERLSAYELATAVEDMAASISSFSGRNSMGLEAEFLSQYLDQGLELMVEVLLRPALAASEVEKARPTILAAIKRQEDRPSSQAFRLFFKTLYGRHPYARDVLGTEESVSHISAEMLRAYYEKWAIPSNMVMAVVGDVDPDQIRKRIGELFKDWRLEKVNPLVINPPAALEGVKTRRLELQKAQTHLVLGFLTPGLKSQEKYALEVLDTVLSGMGGRLFIELRDKQSLAYTVTSFYIPGLDTGAFGFYTAFAPAKFEAVKLALEKIVANVRQEPIGPEELQRAKDNILGLFEIGLQKNRAQAADMAFNERYGLGFDYRYTFVDRINAVTAADVLSVAGRFLDLHKAVAVTVGPAGEWRDSAD